MQMSCECVCVTVSVYVVVVWQGPMEEQFLYWMDFTLYKYIWKKKKKKKKKKIRRPLGRLIFNMGIAIPGKTVFLIETAPRCTPVVKNRQIIQIYFDVFYNNQHNRGWTRDAICF